MEKEMHRFGGKARIYVCYPDEAPFYMHRSACLCRECSYYGYRQWTTFAPRHYLPATCTVHPSVTLVNDTCVYCNAADLYA